MFEWRARSRPEPYMSGYTPNAIVHHGVLDSGIAYIQNPFTPRQLPGAVRLAVDPAVIRRAAPA